MKIHKPFLLKIWTNSCNFKEKEQYRKLLWLFTNTSAQNDDDDEDEDDVDDDGQDNYVDEWMRINVCKLV